MSEPFLGEIIMFGGNFAPRGWAFCNGQLLSIAQNTALFSILGTTYGGDGVTTFALPNLLSRVPVHSGNGVSAPGLSSTQLGEMAGTQAVTLLISNMPPHNHMTQAATATVPVAIPVVVTDGDTQTPSNTKVLAQTLDSVVGAAVNIYATGPGTTTLEPFNATASVPAAPTSAAGSGLPVSILNPFLGVNFIIALEGIFPSRN